MLQILGWTGTMSAVIVENAVELGFDIAIARMPAHEKGLVHWLMSMLGIANEDLVVEISSPHL